MKILVSLVTLASATLASAGSLHDIDVILETVDGRIVTNRVADGGEVVPERVFDADTIQFFNQIATDDPGFNAAPGGLPPFEVMSLDLVAPLKVWDGAAFVNVTPFHFLEVEFNNQDALSPPMDGQETTGPLMNATEFGDIHNHADHFLIVEQEPGIYLGSFRFSAETVEDSEPFYFVYRWEPSSGDVPAAEAEQQVAIQWVRDNLLADPCPTDLDGDGVIGSADLGALLAAWGGPDADLDGDGVTASGDLGVLLAAWGPCE